jgi:hypothetical protein
MKEKRREESSVFKFGEMAPELDHLFWISSIWLKIKIK